MKVVIVSGSTRIGRQTHKIALALSHQINKLDHDASIVDLKNIGLKIFEERYSLLENPSASLTKTAEQLNKAHALIFVTPEYNGGISSSLKNFIDLYAKEPFEGKAIGIATGSPGAMGGIRAAHQLQLLILGAFAYPIPQMLLIGQMHQKIDESGTVTSEDFQKTLDAYLDTFLSFASKLG